MKESKKINIKIRDYLYWPFQKINFLLQKILKSKYKKYFINFIMIAIITSLLLMVDLLTKTFIFDPGISGNGSFSEELPIENDHGIIGTRSLLHTTSTLFDKFNWHPQKWVKILFGFVLIIILLIALFFANNKLFIIGGSIILAGLFGNTIDNTAFDGVRDIFYLPWMDRGTFNFADFLMVAGIPFIVLSFILQLLKSYKEKKSK